MHIYHDLNVFIVLFDIIVFHADGNEDLVKFYMYTFSISFIVMH